MYAQCPSCNTTFALSVEQLDARDGVVRCGRCFDVFNARWNLVDRQSDADPAPVRAPVAKTERPQINIDRAKTDTRPDSPPSLDMRKPAAAPKAPTPSPGSPVSDRPAQSDNAGLVSMRTESPSRPDARAGKDLSAAFGEGDVLPGRRMSDLDAATVKAPAQRSDADDAVVKRTVPESELPKKISTPKSRKQKKARKSRQKAPTERPAFAPDAGAAVDVDAKAPGSDHNRPEIDRSQFDDLSVPDVDPGSAAVTGRGGSGASRWLWGAGVVGLLGLLAIQARAFYLEDIAQRPALRPIGEVFCVVMSCELPDAILIEEFRIEETKIAFHPDAPAAIRISTAVRNGASVAQPYPDLLLTLTNKAGKIVGRRTFRPAQYLGPVFRSDQKLQPDSLTIIDLDLAEPAQNAIGFEVELVKRI